MRQSDSGGGIPGTPVRQLDATDGGERVLDDQRPHCLPVKLAARQGRNPIARRPPTAERVAAIEALPGAPKR